MDLLENGPMIPQMKDVGGVITRFPMDKRVKLSQEGPSLVNIPSPPRDRPVPVVSSARRFYFQPARLITSGTFQRDHPRDIFFRGKSARTDRVFGRLSVRVNMRQCRPLYRLSIGDVCQIKAYIDLFVSALRAVRIPPNDTPSWERNYGMPLRCDDTKGHQVGGNGDAKYSRETRAAAAKGVPRYPPPREIPG